MIRLAAITFANDSAMTFAQFRPPDYIACSPENIFDFCSSHSPGDLALQNEEWLGFVVNIRWSPFPRKESTKSPQICRGKFGAKVGANSER